MARKEIRARIFGRERWDVFELRKRLGIVAGDMPSPRTLETRGIDVVASGFFATVSRQSVSGFA